MADKYENLKLANQICFPLYACSRGVIKAYAPYLEALDLTYTQYVTMIVLWEHKQLKSKQIGALLHLDSSTVTPLLKRLEEKGYVSRQRSTEDARDLIVSITEKGEALKEKALSIPGQLEACIDIGPEKTKALYDILYELLGNLSEE